MPTLPPSENGSVHPPAPTSAASDAVHHRVSELNAEITRPLPGSQKVYVQGSRPDIRVPMREIGQEDTPALFGSEQNPPFFVYDTSGLYSDPKADVDIRRGLPALRTAWIEERGDTDTLDGPSSAFGRKRLRDPKTEHLRFEHLGDFP